MNNEIEPIGRFLVIKRLIAAIILRPTLGRLIGAVFKNKIPHRGSRLRVPFDGDPLLNIYLLMGMYESAEIRFVYKYLDGGVDVIELGSSIGGVSCEISKNLSKNRKLICVEANPLIIDCLSENLERNNPELNVVIIQGAIDYGDSDELFFEIGSNNLSSRKTDSDGGGSGFIRVKAVTLSGIIANNSVSEYSLVCDIEGAEAALFQDDYEAFDNCKTLVIELHSISYGGMYYNPESLIALIERKTKLKLVARYGAVCAFVSDNF